MNIVNNYPQNKGISMQWSQCCFKFSILYIVLITCSFKANEYQFLDNAFGTHGTVITRLNTMSGTMNEVVPSLCVKLQADGNILLVGDSFIHNNSAEFAIINSYCTLIRYNNNGILDTSFGANGIVVIPHISHAQNTVDCAIQNDGKIVVVGRTYQRPEIMPDATIIRLNGDGSLDTSFGINGMIIDDNGDKQWSNFFKVMIQENSKIVVAGSYGTDYPDSDDTLNCCLYLKRYLPDGTLDTTFGTNGVVKNFVNIANRPKLRPALRAGDSAYGAILQCDDKIIVVGPSLDRSAPIDLGARGIFDAAQCDSAIVRYTSDGALDSSFGRDNNGMVITSASHECNFFVDVAVTPDNNIIAIGTAQNENTRFAEFFLARYTMDGILDSSFGENNNGIVCTPLGTGNAIAKNILIQDDGKLLVTGVVQWETGTQFTTVRYLPNGYIDTSFGNNGILSLSIRENSRSFALALQDDAKLIIAGDSSDGHQVDFALARFLKILPESLSI